MKVFDGLTLALVGPLPPPSGGMANQTRQLAELLTQAGARVELVQTNAPVRPVWVERIAVVRAGWRLLPYVVALWRAAGRNRIFHVMANSGWSWHLFAAPAVRIAAWRGVAVVVNYRGGEAASFLERAHRSVAATLARAQVLIVPSGFLEAVFGRFGIVAQVVPNIVDLGRFRPGSVAARQGVQRPHLVVARNLEPIYDNATAIRAFAVVRQRHAGARLTIAGSGPQRSALEALTIQLQLGLSVRFAGRLDRDEMAALYADADLALNPSTADNMPNSVLEAWAAGVPVVSTDVGGVPYIVQEGTTALLVPPRAPEAMARAAIRVLDNPDLAASLIQAGHDEVGRYTWHNVSARLADVYVSALGEDRPAVAAK